MSKESTAINDAYDTLTDAAYCACLLHELLSIVQNGGDASYELSDCALGGLASINRHIFQAVLDGRNQYSELVKE
jgi:hypothetical protein